MGVKGFDLKEPVVLVMILFQKGQTISKCNALRGLFVAYHMPAVCLILRKGLHGLRVFAPVLLRAFENGVDTGLHTQAGLPGIPLLPSGNLPGGIAVMVGAPSSQ